jgi:hypothetical protein
MRRAGTTFVVGWILAFAAVEAAEIGPAGSSPVPGEPREGAKADPGPAIAGVESRGQNFLDLPAPEVSMSAAIGATSAQDEAVAVHGRTDGEVVLVTLENRTLYAQTSTDGGATFGPAVLVAGHPTEPRIEQFRMMAAGTSLYVAYTVGDPGGDVGLRLRRSDDMGRSWTFPSVLVARGSERHGVSDLALDANASGRVAVTFDESWEMRDVWAMVSSDSGATWTPPVRLDSADAGGLWDAAVGDVHVAPDGTVHAAFVQDRGAGPRIWSTRSLDGGLGFAAEQSFDAIVTTPRSSGPALVSASDGSVLLAFYDVGIVSGSDAIHVLRSTNGGASFTLAATKSIPTANGIEPPRPRLLTSPDSPEVLLVVEVNGELRTSASTNAGASFTLDATAATGVRVYGAARTPGGSYVLGWSDRTLQPAVWGASSTNGGLSWNAPKRADQGPGAAAESRFGDVTVAGSETAFLAWLDRRSGEQFDVYAADAPVSALDFTGRERRADTDWPGSDAHAVVNDGALATDGVNVYAALGNYTAGAETMLWVTRSADGGKTFQAAVPVSTSDPATTFVERPRLAALPGGTVYAIWTRWDRDALPYHQALAFSRSLDFGATWSPETVLVDVPGGFAGYSLAATTTALLVFWSDSTDVFARRSTNQGTSFAAAVLLDQLGESGQYPLACVQGNRIVFAYTAGLNGEGIPYARLSGDSGATWGIPVLLSGNGGSANLVLGCDPGTNAVAAWSDPVAGGWRVFANRLSGSVWSGTRTIGGAAGNQFFPTVAFAGSSTWVLGFGDWGTQVFASRSTDGGFNWSAPGALHTGAPQPLAHRELPVVASDGAGNVWFAWWDQSAGRTSLAARHSADGGVNFGPVRRIDRGLPQGANVNDGIYGVLTLPGLGVFGWLGQRVTSYWDIHVNAWSTSDLDRDGSLDAADCDDENGAVYPGAPELCDGIATDCNAPTWPGLPPNEGNADGDSYLDCADNCPNLASSNLNDLDGDGLGDPCDPDRDGDGTANGSDCAPDDPGFAVGPAEVVPVQADKPAATTLQLSWSTVAGATAYDVARGTIAQLRADGSTANAAGVSCSQPGTTYSDTKSMPAGTVHYYLVRGRQGVCVGTWGAGSLGVPRVAAACP